MAKYLEITNDNFNVIVDDQFKVPMLLARYRGLTDTYSDPYAAVMGYYFAVYPWTKSATLKSASTLEGLGFDTRGGTVSVHEITAGLVVGYRVIGSDTACSASASVVYNGEVGMYQLNVSVNSFNGNIDIEMVVYTTSPLKATKETFAIFAADGSLLYDVRRGAMHFLGSMYGEIDLYADIGAVFDFTLPSGVNQSDCFITRKSIAPYFTAMKFSSGGVSDDGTIYKTVMSYPTANTMRITVRRAYPVAGTSNAWGYGGFFENLIHCHQPIGTYL